MPCHDVGHLRHVVGRHRYGRFESVGRPCDRGAIGHLTDELGRVVQRPVAHGCQEDAPIGCGRTDGIPAIAGDVSIQCGIEKARVAEEPEHGPATRLRGEVGGKPSHGGVGAVAGRRHDLASRGIACKHDVQVIAEQCLGDEHGRSLVGVGSPEPGTGGEQRQRHRDGDGNHGTARGRVWLGEADTHQDGGDWDQDSLRPEARRERRAQDGGSDRAAPRRFADAGGNEQSSHCQIEEDRKEKFCGEDVPKQQQARINRHEDDRHKPTGVARRRLGGCCKRQNQDSPRRLLQAHHRPEVARPPATVGFPASSVRSADSTKDGVSPQMTGTAGLTDTAIATSSTAHASTAHGRANPTPLREAAPPVIRAEASRSDRTIAVHRG